MKNKFLVSEDGTHTLASSRYGVTYHSTYGALNESITVFLSAGLQYQLLRGKKEVSVFEMGFGTGLNALLTLIDANKNQILVNYSTIELYPLTIEEASQLNFIEELNRQDHRTAFKMLHSCPPSEIIDVSPYFHFCKYHDNLKTATIPGQYDVIYYDAFAPTVQEDLWTSEIMEKMYTILNPGGVLVTYCAKGSFKRALKGVGFKVEALPGPPGKREMTRAIK